MAIDRKRTIPAAQPASAPPQMQRRSAMSLLRRREARPTGSASPGDLDVVAVGTSPSPGIKRMTSKPRRRGRCSRRLLGVAIAAVLLVAVQESLGSTMLDCVNHDAPTFVPTPPAATCSGRVPSPPSAARPATVGGTRTCPLPTCLRFSPPHTPPKLTHLAFANTNTTALGLHQADRAYPKDGHRCKPTTEAIALPLKTNDPLMLRPRLSKACLARVEALTGSLPLQPPKIEGRRFTAAAHPCATNARRALPTVVPLLKEGLALDAAAMSTAAVAYGEGEPLPQPPTLVPVSVAREWPRSLRFAATECGSEILQRRNGVSVIAAGRGYASFKHGVVQQPWFARHFASLFAHLPESAPRRLVAVDPDMESWHLPPRTSTAPPTVLPGLQVTRHRAVAWDADGFVSFVQRPWSSRIDTARTPPTITSAADFAFAPSLQRLAALPAQTNLTGSSATKRAHFHATYQTVPALDIARLVTDASSENAFVVLLLDADGMEWAVAEHLARTGAWGLVDEVFVECHNGEWMPNWPTRHSPADCHRLLNTLRANGVYAHEWYT